MRRRVLLYLTLISVSACNGDRIAKSSETPANRPSTDISDAAHDAVGFTSNPDFFFLPPMVKSPSGNAAWDAGGFNPSLHPTVEICAYSATITTEVALIGAPCGAPTSALATLAAGEEAYQLNWKVPTSSTTFYRITVKVGTKTLGFADVETAPNASQLKNVATGDFIPLNDGRTLPIKFRIERNALCDTPGDPTKPCTSATVDLTVDNTVSTVLPGTQQPSGIFIPAQSPTAPEVTVTVQSCTDFNPRVTDLRTFGPCFRVTADDGTPRSDGHFVFTNPATAFSCEVDAAVHAAITAGTLSATQEPLVTLHRLDDAGTQSQRIAALQHAPACGKGTIGSTGGIRGMLASLGHGEVRQAARQALALLAPKPAYASMFIDLGGGGFTDALSDFQFALPAKMQMVAGVDGQVFPSGSTVSPTVAVTDLHGDPVAGATVHFGATAATTTAAGTASVPWTIANGSNTLSVTGRGIAGPGNDGPRDSFDPFQPIHSAFDDVIDGPEVAVGVGSLTFSASGLFPEGYEAVAESWTNSGYWHRSTLTGPRNVVLGLQTPLVTLAPGDNSAGALPTPFAGARALWFGSEPDGNYAGALASTFEFGGTSSAVRSGTALSPVFTLPTSATTVGLRFKSWFEIESVNPATFDLMTVSLQDLTTGTTSRLRRLNPASDPGGSSRVPFTSGGFNLPPVWSTESADLSAYKGHQVRLLFEFNTGDQRYNAFRGWIVDDVTVVLGTGATFARIPLTSTRDVTSVGTDVFPVREYKP